MFKLFMLVVHIIVNQYKVELTMLVDELDQLELASLRPPLSVHAAL